VQLLVLSGLSSPVSFDSHNDLLRVQRPNLMVHDLALPPHPICDPLHLHKDLHCVPKYHCAFWPQYPVHLQKNVCYVTPASNYNRFRMPEYEYNQATRFDQISFDIWLYEGKFHLGNRNRLLFYQTSTLKIGAGYMAKVFKVEEGVAIKS